MKIRKQGSNKNGVIERRCEEKFFSVKLGEIFISPNLVKFSFNFNRIQ